MTVFFHIGHHKTGTSSIQATMHRNAALLRDRYSINYPGFDANHWSFAVPFLTGEAFAGYGTVASDRGVTRRAREAVAGFRKDARRYRTHVLSAEDFFHLRVATLQNIRRFFADNGHEVKVVAYVRHPAELASSKLNQRIIMGKASLESFEVGTNFVKRSLMAYVSAFGKDALVVRRFGKAYFEGNGLIGDFLSVIHPEPIELPALVTRNESLTMPAVRVVDALNRIGPRGSPLRGRDGYVREMAGPKFVAARDVVAAFVASQAESLDFLATEFGIRFDDIDMASYPEAMDTDFSDATVASIAAILNAQSRRIRELETVIETLSPMKGRRRQRRSPQNSGRR